MVCLNLLEFSLCLGDGEIPCCPSPGSSWTPNSFAFLTFCSSALRALKLSLDDKGAWVVFWTMNLFLAKRMSVLLSSISLSTQSVIYNGIASMKTVLEHGENLYDACGYSERAQEKTNEATAWAEVGHQQNKPVDGIAS